MFLGQNANAKMMPEIKTRIVSQAQKPQPPNKKVNSTSVIDSLSVTCVPVTFHQLFKFKWFWPQGLIMIFVKGMLTLYYLLFLGYRMVEWDEWLICSLMTAVRLRAGPISAVITLGHHILTLSWYVGKLKFCHRYQT